MAHPSVFGWYWYINGGMSQCEIPKGVKWFMSDKEKASKFHISEEQ